MYQRQLILAALLGLLACLPAQAQTGVAAFNPFTMLVPILTPLGAMLVPVTNAPAPNQRVPNLVPSNPAMLNPAAYNPARFNPAPQPVGMVPFSGLQESPQSYYGVPTVGVVAVPVSTYPANPYPVSAYPTSPYGTYPAIPRFQLPSFPAFTGGWALPAAR